MLDAVAVDDRVAADHGGDHEPERGAAASARAADEQDAGCDDGHAGDLARGRIASDEHDRVQERGDRREPSSDGIDERQLEAPVRGREQREVHELEQARRQDVPPGTGVDVPRAAANGARTSTNAIADTAAAASVSAERRSSRFQTACSVAAPSASASAESAT